jgi:hypothetical protein
MLRYDLGSDSGNDSGKVLGSDCNAQIFEKN